MQGETRPEDVLGFWFDGLGPDDLPTRATFERWFEGGEAFDRAVRERFGEAVRAACEGDLDHWAESARGRLALVLLLDQLTRNVHRSTARAFAGDARALAQARAALSRREDRELRPVERYFLYMPFMHAEDAAQQRRSVALFERLASDAEPDAKATFELGLAHAREHRDTIHRFGRFPARNQALGRASTPEELAFLEETQHS
jgi:uncharacterized protein (DUF924 family)